MKIIHENQEYLKNNLLIINPNNNMNRMDFIYKVS